MWKDQLGIFMTFDYNGIGSQEKWTHGGYEIPP